MHAYLPVQHTCITRFLECNQVETHYTKTVCKMAQLVKVLDTNLDKLRLIFWAHMMEAET